VSIDPAPTSNGQRSQLLTLLTEACELEHGLACCYLYAAFTLKQNLSEGGLDWQQLQRVRYWAAQLYFIAAQEMLHLAQAWNLLTAIGGIPYYLRPNFPQPAKYYPLDLALHIQRFSLGTLDRFIQFERPDDVPVKPEEPLTGQPALTTVGQPAFTTVGELYELIAQGFKHIPNVIIGDPKRQVTQDLIDFPQLIPVHDRNDALAAITLITTQGEGIKKVHQDCHFEIFRNIRREYLTELATTENVAAQDHSEGTLISDYDPVRPAISDPVAVEAPYLGDSGANVITDPVTQQFASCFDSIYTHMLRMLQYVFDNATGNPALLRAFGRGALEAMTAVVKPLGEALTLMPAGPGYENQTAGPGFALGPHIALPADPRAAAIVNAEWLRELSDTLNGIAPSRAEIVQVTSAATNLAVIADRFAGLCEQSPAT
jgi:hypothetical protein